MSLINPELPKKIRENLRKGKGISDLRVKVFQETVRIVKNGGYDFEGKFIKIDNENVIENSVLFDAPPKNRKKGEYDTKFIVIQGDTLEVTELIVKAGLNPAALNMANSYVPGGGVIGGAGAQEENIFRRTNLFLSLYQFSEEYAKYVGIKNNEKQYPMNPTTGGAYSPNITVFRASEQKGYELLKEPFKVSIISVAAINGPNLRRDENGKYWISDSQVPIEKEKIRTILRIGANFKHDSLVLGAWGCGAFETPPEHMAKLFKEVFEEEEFKTVFKLVAFAILNNSNSWSFHNPEGNLYPFFKVFNE